MAAIDRSGRSPRPATFGDLGLLLDERTATVSAITDVQAWRIPRARFERLVRDRPAAWARDRARARQCARPARPREGRRPAANADQLRSMAMAPLQRRSAFTRVVAMAISIGVPAALWLLPAPSGLSSHGVAHRSSSWSAAPSPGCSSRCPTSRSRWRWRRCGAWLGSPRPRSHSAGFASSAWVTAVAALGIAAAMAASGLLFRVALMLLRVFPPTHRGQAAALLVGGVVLTPLVPTVFGRVATVAPVARELSPGPRPREGQPRKRRDRVRRDPRQHHPWPGIPDRRCHELPDPQPASGSRSRRASAGSDG